MQARWSFVNKDENLLTRLQNINLCFHFEVEQQVNGVYLSFFGFNGTAGVWRIKALEDSGGWMERTTVEDMDIAVRAHLNGWKFIFLNDVKVCMLTMHPAIHMSMLHGCLIRVLNLRLKSVLAIYSHVKFNCYSCLYLARYSYLRRPTTKYLSLLFKTLAMATMIERCHLLHSCIILGPL